LGLPFRFRPGQAGPLQIVGAQLDMRANLLFEFVIDPGTMEDIRDQRSKVGQNFHDSSGCAESADAMAAARRFHSSVSSRRRFRPAAVSS
jgi:hypothetical protein